MATQQKSARTPNRVPRRRTSSSLSDRLSIRSKTAMLLAAASLLTVGMVGGGILAAKERQAKVLREHNAPQILEYHPIGYYPEGSV